MKVTINKKIFALNPFTWGDICRLSEQGIKISDFANLDCNQMTTMYLVALNRTPDKTATQEEIEALPLGHPLFQAKTIQVLLDTKPEKNG